MPLDKASVIEALRAELGTQLERMSSAARSTESAATDPENRAENKYDTRGLEASYLAAGQAERVEELERSLSLLHDGAFPDIAGGQPIAAGALVETELDGEPSAFLLASAAGGVELEVDGTEVTVLAPGSPLRQQLDGLLVGDSLDSPPLRVTAIS